METHSPRKSNATAVQLPSEIRWDTKAGHFLVCYNRTSKDLLVECSALMKLVPISTNTSDILIFSCDGLRCRQVMENPPAKVEKHHLMLKS